jgi:hypothetical protein
MLSANGVSLQHSTTHLVTDCLTYHSTAGGDFFLQQEGTAGEGHTRHTHLRRSDDCGRVTTMVHTCTRHLKNSAKGVGLRSPSLQSNSACCQHWIIRT